MKNTKLLGLGMLMLFGLGVAQETFAAKAQFKKYNLDVAHSELGFKVSHLVISKVHGSFKKFEGTFQADPEKLVLKDVNVNIDVGSIETNEKDRDAHLVGPDFFDAKKFPKAEFKIKGPITLKQGSPIEAKGTLKIKGVSKSIPVNITYNGSAVDPWGNKKHGFEVTASVNRKEFGVNWNKTLDQGGVMVGETVDMLISAQASPDAGK